MRPLVLYRRQPQQQPRAQDQPGYQSREQQPCPIFFLAFRHAIVPPSLSCPLGPPRASPGTLQRFCVRVPLPHVQARCCRLRQRCVVAFLTASNRALRDIACLIRSECRVSPCRHTNHPYKLLIGRFVQNIFSLETFL